jgi:AraC-like DNA-binding protein
MDATTSPKSLFPSIHVSIISSFVDFFLEVGAPVERGLARAKLPIGIVDDPSNYDYLPCRTFTNWLATECRFHGIDDIGSRTIQRSGINGLHPSVVASIKGAPTLYRGLHRLCDIARLQSTRVEIWCEEDERSLRICHRGSFSRDVAGQVDMTWWALGILTSVVRLFTGPEWLPEWMGVPAQREVSRFASETYCNANFVSENDYAWIAVPHRLLPNPSCDDHDAGIESLPEPEEEFAASVEQMLRLSPFNAFPTIETAADIAGTSVRTFQRLLSNDGTSYRELANGIRFEHAIRLLRSSNATVTDVARSVGYHDSSHFARAFRRLARVSPREYRNSHVQPAKFN